MEWGNKFSTLMKDTEFNLQRVKDRLSSTRTSQVINLSPFSDTTKIYKSINTDSTLLGSEKKANVNDFTSFTIGGISSLSNYNSPAKTEFDYKSPHQPITNDTNNLLAGTSLEASSGAFMVLYDKLDNQEQQLEKLTENMKHLEKERDQYYNQVQSLKGELVAINTRMSEKGVDLVTEQKIDLWRRDMMQEMQDLQAQFRHLRSKNEELGLNTNHSDLQREMQDMRRILQSEFGSIHTEVESIKTRLLALEVTLDKVTVKNYDFNYRQKRLETTKSDFLATMKESREQSGYVMSVASLQHLKHARFTSSHEVRDITELRRSINDIAHKITQIEGTVHQDTLREKRKKTNSLSKPQPDLTSIGSDLDVSSTVDLSELNTADLVSLSPTLKRQTFSDDFDMTVDVDTDDLLSVEDLTADFT